MILVTGATGLLGSHLCYELLKQGKKVRAIKRSSRNIPELRKVFSYYSDTPSVLLEKIEWIDADILNYQEMLDVMDGVNQVYHCAAIVSFDPAKRANMIHSNREGTANIVNASLEKGIEKLLHVSSTAAIGRALDGKPADETVVWSESGSNTGYSISKFHSEMEVWRGIQEGLNAVIVNPSIILGPGFWNHGSSSIFSKIDKGFRYYASGMTGYVGVWDVVRIMMLLMDSEISGERFLVTAENLTYKQVFELVADKMNRPRPSVEANRFLSGLAWRADWLKSKVLGIGEYTFTSERVRSAMQSVSFSNKKLVETLGYEYEPIEEVVRKVASYY